MTVTFLTNSDWNLEGVRSTREQQSSQIEGLDHSRSNLRVGVVIEPVVGVKRIGMPCLRANGNLMSARQCCRDVKCLFKSAAIAGVEAVYHITTDAGCPHRAHPYRKGQIGREIFGAEHDALVAHDAAHVDGGDADVG